MKETGAKVGKLGHPLDHPWSRFLEARAEAICWLRDDGQTDAQIANTLSMDTMQVTLIRMSMEDKGY
jgi:hypothetical protein